MVGLLVSVLGRMKFNGAAPIVMLPEAAVAVLSNVPSAMLGSPGCYVNSPLVPLCTIHPKVCSLMSNFLLFTFASGVKLPVISTLPCSRLRLALESISLEKFSCRYKYLHRSIHVVYLLVSTVGELESYFLPLLLICIQQVD